MIFITLGSQRFQFNRLLKAVDEQIADGRITDQIFAQIGASNYKPQCYDFKNFLTRTEFGEWIDKADIVITHGGTGAIISSLKKDKKVIAIPRLSKYGEHVDDHQLQLVSQFRDLNLICECVNCNEIWKAINVAKKSEYNKYQSNTTSIIDNIEHFLEEL